MAHRQRLGASYLGEERSFFRVWAPFATQVAVRLLDAPPRLVPLTRRGEYFTGLVDGVRPGSRYRYCLDGQREFPDPASRSQPEGVHGPSQVVDLRFPWTDEGWRGLPLRDYVIYEIHVGTYTPTGTFAALVPHLPRLRELGVTALELMPVAQFPGDRNWGYDGVYLYAVQQSYGGAAGLQALVDACHRYGLAVILDVVYNHLGPEGNYTWQYGPYATDRYSTPWGQAMNVDQAYSDGVREFFLNNALEWFRDYHIDALRLDALHAMVDMSARPFLAELAEAVARFGEQSGRRLYLLAESDDNNVRLLRPPELGGFGLQGHWLEDFHHALHVLLTGEREGYYQDFAGLEDLATAYRQGFVYTGQYSPYRRRRHGSWSGDIRPYRFIAFAQNHDQVGNRPGGERLTQLTTPAGAELAAAAVILSPFTPLLFMGEEYGEPAPFHYFISHTDPELVEAVRQGRRQALAGGGDPAAVPDPQNPQTLAASRLDLSLQEQQPHRSRWRLYQRLLQLRRDMLTAVDLGWSYPQVRIAGTPPVLMLHYQGQGQQYCVVFNFNEEVAQVALPGTGGLPWRLRLTTSADPDDPGTADLTEVPGTGVITLSARGCQVYHCAEELTC